MSDVKLGFRHYNSMSCRVHNRILCHFRAIQIIRIPYLKNSRRVIKFIKVYNIIVLPIQYSRIHMIIKWWCLSSWLEINKPLLEKILWPPDSRVSQSLQIVEFHKSTKPSDSRVSQISVSAMSMTMTMTMKNMIITKTMMSLRVQRGFHVIKARMSF